MSLTQQVNLLIRPTNFHSLLEAHNEYHTSTPLFHKGTLINVLYTTQEASPESKVNLGSLTCILLNKLDSSYASKFSHQYLTIVQISKESIHQLRRYGSINTFDQNIQCGQKTPNLLVHDLDFKVTQQGRSCTL